MNRRFVLAAVAAALGLCAGQAAHAECKLQLLDNVPLTFVNGQPMVEASINGKPAHLRLTISPSIILWGSALKTYGLKEAVGQSVGTAHGPGGATDATAALVHELKVGDVSEKDRYFYVLYGVQKDDEAGVFGTSLFDAKNDLEFDFAHNVVRVFKEDGCKDDEVVYWGGQYSVVQNGKGGFLPVKLSGKTLRGALSAGNEVTFVTLDGAQNAGVALKAAGPLPMGMVAGGAIKPIDVSIANFPELTIGDETIKNAPLAVGDVYPHSSPGANPDIILGADFIRSHRIYLSRKQGKVYFSYVGGVLFGDIYKRLGIEAPPKP